MSIEKYKETWFIVPRYISELPGITLSYLKVYDTMFQFWNKNLTCFLSNTAITERTGVMDREIFRALNFFEINNCLERKQIGLKRYLIQPKNKIETDGEDITQDRQLGHPPLTIGSPPPDPIVIHNIKNLNKETKQDLDLKPLSDSKKSPDEYHGNNLFMQFYQNYPRKEKPKEAFKAFLKLKATDEFVHMLLNDLINRQANNWLGRDRSKIPHPSTYLNQREWEGEIFKVKENTTPKFKYKTMDEILPGYYDQLEIGYD